MILHPPPNEWCTTRHCIFHSKRRMVPILTCSGSRINHDTWKFGLIPQCVGMHKSGGFVAKWGGPSGHLTWPLRPPERSKTKNRKKGRVEGQVRWPFGPPHLTLNTPKNNRELNKNKEITIKDLFHLSVKFSVLGSSFKKTFLTPQVFWNHWILWCFSGRKIQSFPGSVCLSLL